MYSTASLRELEELKGVISRPDGLGVKASTLVMASCIRVLTLTPNEAYRSDNSFNSHK